jgi:hypothetical protein
MTVWRKQGVLGDLHREMRRAVGALATFYAARGLDLQITSVREGTHSAGSLHYDGCAIDFRGQGVPVVELRRLLGSAFDVVEEPDHIHVEYDPKP